MNKAVEQRWISGFWRRLGALGIDYLLMIAIGAVLSLFLEGLFLQIGQWGRLIGFTIALVYFGVLNSSIAGGQTLGKRAMKIRVVNSVNSPIGLGKSVLRYIVLGIPFALNGIQLPSDEMFSWLIYPITIVFLGGLTSIIYLYLFNRSTRQSLHDLAVGTYVVNANVEQQEVGKVWNVHLIMVAMFFLLSAIAPAIMERFAQGEEFEDLQSTYSILSNNPDLYSVSVNTGTTAISSVREGTRTVEYVRADVSLKSNNIGDVALARQLAFIILENYPGALQKDVIQINMSYEYSIGIFSKWYNHSHSFSPLELQALE